LRTNTDEQRADDDFDCVEFKRRAQAKIHGEIQGMTHAEELAYFRKRADEGWIGEWWRSMQGDSRTVRERPQGRADERE
jgi:hypothetical protein